MSYDPHMRARDKRDNDSLLLRRAFEQQQTCLSGVSTEFTSVQDGTLKGRQKGEERGHNIVFDWDSEVEVFS